MKDIVHANFYQLKGGKISKIIMSNRLSMIFAWKITHENQVKCATHDIRMKSFDMKFMRLEFSYHFNVKIMRNWCENFHANLMRGSIHRKMMRKFRTNFMRISYEIHAWHNCLCMWRMKQNKTLYLKGLKSEKES